MTNREQQKPEGRFSGVDNPVCTGRRMLFGVEVVGPDTGLPDVPEIKEFQGPTVGFYKATDPRSSNSPQ